ncbi:speedy protein A isoform X1 [Erpetoichthys calabaricus]|uniref:Speedy/RINGO cell cycle regulator family member A n=1 Tax=Erpetoichthys calabaricus TaxID=27687 RepID=A0A8C4RG35_ERPCA|nr:speedy protein A isoform X1 [Erpetoichthys calabaricus]XP_028653196.1 speedy protein A isoform X1 [Erpetoichthys calabaricus]XP_051780972.1 speedy protein A isoform X1 [Erpetoichthys calabaricus]
MIKVTQNCCKTPASVVVHMKSVASRSLQHKKSLHLKRPVLPEEHQTKNKSNKTNHLEGSPSLLIGRQEMTAFFKLFDDDLIQDFLWMDCCCKITDKYLLAMTFVYFKRAKFSIVEHTRMNFFVALYLANTMEEDDEESKYEIFPWALGKNWRKHFHKFLMQRDLLWARIKYRAVVSRLCCEEVMAIAPSHSIWQRERAEHHSGAIRNYAEREDLQLSKDFACSTKKCSLCRESGQFLELFSSSSDDSSSPPANILKAKTRTTKDKTKRPRRMPDFNHSSSDKNVSWGSHRISHLISCSFWKCTA